MGMRRSAGEERREGADGDVTHARRPIELGILHSLDLPQLMI
jgi:hypothetical protein